jgi:HPt (histidine-containing phosphotransfer) domain-containing protein
MGYIERLAAGILREEEDTETALPPVATAARTAASIEDRIAQLEGELDTANVVLSEKDREIAELRLELEEVQTQLALQRSVDDD